MTWRVWAGLALTGACSCWTWAGSYTFTRIGSTVDGFVDLHRPSISRDGHVAFFTSQAGVWTLRVSDGATTTPLIDSSGDLQAPASMGFVGLADDDVAVSFWTLDAGGSGIFIVDDGIATPIATTAGPFSSFEDFSEGSQPAMNNKHQIAYWAKLDDGGSGMFTGPDIVKHKVIRTGDALDGAIVLNTRHGKGISDTGQVCFLATIAGSVGVYRADPVPACVPADLNCDSHVNGLDLGILLGLWTGAATYSPCPPAQPADLNQDCKVNGLDLATLLAAWTG